MTITGPGAALLAIGGGGGMTVFTVNSGVTATIGGLTIQHGNASITDCISGDICGGGIFNRGTLTVTNSTLISNIADGGSGAGGGISNGGGGTLTVTNSTFSGNRAGNGGGIYNDGGGTLTVTNGTLSGNTGLYGGGGILNNGATVTVTNTIVVGNTTSGYSGPDLKGTITSGGHNLFGTTSGATITLGPGDLVNPNPVLGPLGSNGGPTQTVPLLAGSPAINAGSDAVCAGATVGNKDQRGIARPFGAHCDIGAFEYQPPPNPLPPPRPAGPVLGPPAPNPLPAARPAAASGGPTPNPLPAPRR